MAGANYPTIGCCGLDCGLCPRYYTEGSSRCPGCGGEGFEQKHPSCGFLTCCVKKQGLSVCAECGEFPCKRFDKETGEYDSFILHRLVMPNQRKIAEMGIDEYVRSQESRMQFLDTAIRRFNDGRSKNYFCIAATLLTVESLNTALARAEAGESLRVLLDSYAQKEGKELRLRK